MPVRSPRLALALSLAACSSSVSSAPDAGDVDAPDAGESFTLKPIQVVSGHPGSPVVIAAPRLMAITYADDPKRADIDAFVGVLGGSGYWSAVGAEYGVNAATGATGHLTQAAPGGTITDDDIKALITSSLDGTIGTPDANTIYMLFVPSSTTVQIASNGAQSCREFAGFHGTVSISGTDYAFGVTANCQPRFGLSELDFVTAVASHEYVEAASDPKPPTGYAALDAEHLPLGFFMGTEIGDLCGRLTTSYAKPSDIGYGVQRIWSNAAARDGKNPCVPADNVQYVNAVPGEADHDSLGTLGVHIAVGQSRTFGLHLISDPATTSTWTVSVEDPFGLTGSDAVIQIALDHNTGTTGDVLPVTITMLKAPPGPNFPFHITSQLGDHKFDSWGTVIP